MPRIFLSHSSHDKPTAQRIAVDLQVAGIDVWFDEWEIKVGHSITQKIQSGISGSDYVVVLLTEHSVQSGWVEKEWQSRIGIEARDGGVHVLPVLVDNCEIPILLVDKKYADLRNGYAEGIQELVFAVYGHHPDFNAISAGARIETGVIVIDSIDPPIQRIDEFVTTIIGGSLARNSNGLAVVLETVSPMKSLQEFAVRKNLTRLFLTAGATHVSKNVNAPTEFRGQQRVTFVPGERMVDVLSGSEIVVPVAMEMLISVTAFAHMEGAIAKGAFKQHFDVTPNLSPQFAFMGSFELRVAV